MTQWKWKTWFLIILCLGLQAPAPAENPTPGLETQIRQALSDWQVPGLAVAVVKDDSLQLCRGFGVKEYGKADSVDANTLFAIASNTKAFTAAALGILADEGKLDWDDRVQDYLPWFQLYDPWVSREFRIRDLLCHRSGLKTFSGDLIWYTSIYSREDVIRRARYLKPAYGFRTRYGYSNIMFLAAGEIIPAVTGQSWDDFVAERFFRPLGMQRTITTVGDLARLGNAATPHVDLHPIPWTNWDNIAPAGGIISSVADISRWLRLQLHRGEWEGKRIFSREASREMWQPHTPLPLSERTEKIFPTRHFAAYGLGWAMFDYHGRKVLTHGGGYDGMVSRVALVPEENLGLVILTNNMTSICNPLMYEILDAYLNLPERDWNAEYLQIQARRDSLKAAREKKERESRVKNTHTSLPLEKYTGTYGGPMYGDAQITLEEGRLLLRFLPTPQFVAYLEHWHYDTFRLVWKEFSALPPGKVLFKLNMQGQVEEMVVDVPNPDFDFTELEFRKK